MAKGRRVPTRVGVTLALMGGLLIGIGPAAHAAPPTTCAGTALTQPVGTAGDDVLVGDGGVNVIHGFSGNDFIGGHMADDRLCGGSGSDVVQGQKGNDRLFGGPGADTLNGGDDDDIIDGAGDNGGDAVIDFLVGDDGMDTCIGDAWDNFHASCENQVIEP